MKACAECTHRTQVHLCGVAQYLGIGVVWCRDQAEPITTTSIDRHLSNLSRLDRSQYAQYLADISKSEGRCVAEAVRARRIAEMKKGAEQ